LKGNGPLVYFIEPMRWDDVPFVMEIERESFPLPWSSYTYRHELTENKHSHYIVIRSRTSKADRRAWWKRLLRLGTLPIIGYGGFWLIADEAHISTLAVAPKHRSKGLGELLLVHMIKQALGMKATMVTLEVRVSNHVAQNLYHKYGFVITGTRLRYYRDNDEDAHIMTVDGVASPEYQKKFADLQAALESHLRDQAKRPAGQKAMAQL
jgi:ribosomal-protein-alanine N-acetyltransferase